MQRTSSKLSLIIILLVVLSSIGVASVIILTNTNLDYQSDASSTKTNPVIDQVVDKLNTKVKKKNTNDRELNNLRPCTYDFECEFNEECINNYCGI